VTMSNTDILARLDSAFKGIIEPTDLGDSILQPQKFAQFVRAMQAKANILAEARFIEMTAQQADIDRIGFVGRILKSGTDATNAHRQLAEADYAEPAFHTNRLIAKELQAIASLRDKTLRRNIERGGLEDTLIDLFGEAAGRDLEEWALLADTAIAWADDDILTLTDGWLKKAANKIYGVESGVGVGDNDFDPADVESMFEAALTAVPKQFLVNKTDWRFWVPWEVENSYRNLLKARGTQLGDSVQTGSGELAYKGFSVRYAPMLERSKAYDGVKNFAGRVALFGHPDNMAWGVFHEVTVERDRVPKDRRTDFVLTVEADAGYEDENAAVAIFIDRPNVP